MAKMNIRIGRDNDGVFRITGDKTTSGIIRAVSQARDNDTVGGAKTLGNTLIQHQQEKMVKKRAKRLLDALQHSF